MDTLYLCKIDYRRLFDELRLIPDLAEDILSHLGPDCVLRGAAVVLVRVEIPTDEKRF